MHLLRIETDFKLDYCSFNTISKSMSNPIYSYTKQKYPKTYTTIY